MKIEMFAILFYCGTALSLAQYKFTVTMPFPEVWPNGPMTPKAHLKAMVMPGAALAYLLGGGHDESKAPL